MRTRNALSKFLDGIAAKNEVIERCAPKDDSTPQEELVKIQEYVASHHQRVRKLWSNLLVSVILDIPIIDRIWRILGGRYLSDGFWNFPKFERDGKIAVVFSWHSTWSSCCDDEWKPLMTMHRYIVQSVMDGNCRKATVIASELIKDAMNADYYAFPEYYTELGITWVLKGAEFEIVDGEPVGESVRIIDRGSFLKA